MIYFMVQMDKMDKLSAEWVDNSHWNMLDETATRCYKKEEKEMKNKKLLQVSNNFGHKTSLVLVQILAEHENIVQIIWI